MVKDENYLETDHSLNEPKSFHTLRLDNELFDDAVASQPLKVLNVKRVKLPKNGEDWEIIEDDEIVLVLKGTRFTNTEKTFLRTVEGMKFLMAQYKDGKKSVTKIKEEMKNVL